MTEIPVKMKALIMTGYNKLELGEMPVPVPGEGQVLCRIRAVAICGSDPGILGGMKPGVWPRSFPFVLGHEWAGEIVALGSNVGDFKIGDRVAGEAHNGCGTCANCLAGRYTLCLNYGKPETGHRHFGFNSLGANCEYNVYPIKSISKIPDTLSFKHATLVDTAGVALHAIELIGVTPAGTVVIYGPGPMGICAMQIVKKMGTANVIVVGRGYRLELAKKLGADYVVNFSKEDPVEAIRKITNGIGADEAIECSGADIAPMQCVQSVKKGGKVVLIAFNYSKNLPFPIMGDLTLNEITLVGSRANPNVSKKVITMLDKKMIDGDTLITHVFPLEEYEKGLDTFVNRKDNCLKVVIEP